MGPMPRTSNSINKSTWDKTRKVRVNLSPRSSWRALAINCFKSTELAPVSANPMLTSTCSTWKALVTINGLMPQDQVSFKLASTTRYSSTFAVVLGSSTFTRNCLRKWCPAASRWSRRIRVMLTCAPVSSATTRSKMLSLSRPTLQLNWLTRVLSHAKLMLPNNSSLSLKELALLMKRHWLSPGSRMNQLSQKDVKLVYSLVVSRRAPSSRTQSKNWPKISKSTLASCPSSLD